jgi:hypothetical protein
MKFKAEVKEDKVRSTASLDREIRLVLITDDPQAVELQKYIAQDVVEVEVK